MPNNRKKKYTHTHITLYIYHIQSHIYDYLPSEIISPIHIRIYESTKNSDIIYIREILKLQILSF